VFFFVHCQAIITVLTILSILSPVEHSAEVGIDAYARKPATNGSGGRHLGPTLNEVVQLSKDLRSQRAQTSANASNAPKKVGKILGGSGKFELVAGGPSREQVHALLNLGITNMPKTKEEASLLIREMRDNQIAQRLGMTLLKKQTSASEAEAAPSPAAHLPEQKHGPEEHLNMALRGLNMITRRPSTSS